MIDPTPAVTEDGRIIWLDTHGNRDFSPRVQRRVQRAVAASLATVTLLAVGFVTGVVPAASWSPLAP